MIYKRYTGISIVAVGAAMLSLGLLGAGCHSNTTTASNGGTVSTGSSGNAGGGVPIAKPGAAIGANNPPAGQPNHMTPEMQAQLEHYRGMGQQTGAGSTPNQQKNQQDPRMNQ